jgi:radical SAM superfamily enzyme YgiQ (UPF0313 family)
MNISLVFPPLYGVDMPPLGLAYIAAQLIKCGHKVEVFCLNSQLYNEAENKMPLWDWDKTSEWSTLDKINSHFDVKGLLEKWAQDILKDNPRIVGMSVNNYSRILADLLAAKLKEKKPGICVIFGGPWCTEVLENNQLDKNVDIYVRGEGEAIIAELAERIARNEPPAGFTVKGTIINAGSEFKDNGWSNSPVDINSVPRPALELFNFNNYTNKDEIPIIFSRGCNYNCKFCTDKPIWGNHRMRKADNIIEEMARHSRMFARKRFKCNDLMVNGDLGELSNLCDLAINRKLDFEWGSMARARPDMTQEMFNRLRLAGCIYLTYGIESGAAKVLSHMGKPVKKTIARALKMTHAAGIKVNTLWMAGYPVEGWLDVIETMLFLFLNRRHIDEFVSVSSCYIPKKSWLGQQQEALKIEYNGSSEWYIKNRNTPRIRDLRRRGLMSFAGILGLYRGGIK